MHLFISLIIPLFAFATTVEEAAVDSYIYAYPLVTMDYTAKVMTNTATLSENKAPMNQFLNYPRFPDPSFTDVTTPNADTLYSSAFLDLSKGPYILHVPNEDGRYYLMEMLDAWTNVFASPGTRTTGTKEANFAITGPDWKGQLPSGVQEIKSSTNLVWILGRTYSSGTPEDIKAVNEIQSKYTLTPLASFGKSYTPPTGKVDPSVDMKTPVREQVNNLKGEAFFKQVAELLKSNPPTKADSAILEKLALIGIVPGKDFNPSQEAINAINEAPKKALDKIVKASTETGENLNGWHFSTDVGTYGTNYLQRAVVTYIGLGANLPQDAIYPFTDKDSSGNPLNGDNKYVVHFEKGNFPPVKGFWSLTLYNDKFYFVANPLNRYNVGSKDKFNLNSDGSLDIYIQNENPGKDKEANWLPAPKTPFVLFFRFYWPEESILKGEWKPPAVKKA
jgi:DNA sulfur modification protein DndE